MQNLKMPISLAQFLLEYMELSSPCIVKETIDTVYKKEIEDYFKKIDKCAKKLGVGRKEILEKIIKS